MKDEIPNTWEELIEMMDFISDCSGDFLRSKKDEDYYQKVLKSVSREEYLINLNKKIGDDNEPVILVNNFPYTKLLSKLTKIKHYVLWNKKGKLNVEEIREIIKNNFGDKRWCWMERTERGKSVPEIWHCHIFVENVIKL